MQLLGDIVQGVRLSRSRPWIKNDNRFVEQKNYTLVRAYLGDDRLASREQRDLWNGVLELLRIYNNCFQPVLRMVEKSVLRDDSGRVRIRRKHDEARTPFERLCETGALDPTERQRLEKLRDQTNPRHLRLQIYRWLDQLLALPNAKAGATEDISETLQPAGCGEPQLWICGQLSPSSDLPTYPQLLRLVDGKNGKSKSTLQDIVTR